MRPREVLAKNLKRLMEARPHLDTLPKITKATGISNGTLDRMRRAAVAVRIDELADLAAAFDLAPWQLLTPNIDPSNPPTLHIPTATERALYERLQREIEELGALRGFASTRPGTIAD